MDFSCYVVVLKLTQIDILAVVVPALRGPDLPVKGGNGTRIHLFLETNPTTLVFLWFSIHCISLVSISICRDDLDSVSRHFYTSVIRRTLHMLQIQVGQQECALCACPPYKCLTEILKRILCEGRTVHHLTKDLLEMIGIRVC